MATLTRRSLLVLSGSTLIVSACGQAKEESAPQITLKDAFMRPPPNGRDMSAAYLTILNTGDTDTLLSVASPMASDVQMHNSVMEDAVMRMRREDKVMIAAHDTTAFQPGGRHLMVFGLKDGMKTGDEIPFVLNFKKAGTITVMAKVGNGP
jgi:periplasmic copper chaperone A